MKEIYYLFKRAVDGVWIFGKNVDCEHQAGICRPAPSTDRTSLSIIYFQKNEANPSIYDVPVTNFLDESGATYANFAALKAAYAGFFFNVSSSSSGSEMTFTNSLTGLRGRFVERAGNMCIDAELTATGFAGTESVDEGVTGDWINRFSFPL